MGDHELEPALPVLTLSPDYRAVQPLWGSAKIGLDLPARLWGELGDWQQWFDDHFLPESGWTTNEARDQWAEKAKDLEWQLRRAIWGKAELEVNLWPLVGGY